ncbi:glycosyltransferase family 2 protein, partial [Vibrio jasicida]|uniref:glycosyltransferase family 2 protein n=1 Tax=Vibrio jasicida TaxID=766224 RepID=UPI0011B00803
MLISIIVPVYNGEKYIESCIKSIVRSEVKDIEVIVVNDGSTDNTETILQELQLSINNLKVISQNNQGVSKARDVGVLNAISDWIMFVDADDLLSLNALETITKDLSSDDDIIIYSVDYLDGEKYADLTERVIDSETGINELISTKLYSAPFGKVYSKKLFTSKTIDITRKINRGEDFLMNLALFSRASKIRLRNKV